MLSKPRLLSRRNILNAFLLWQQLLVFTLFMACAGRHFRIFLEHGILFALFRLSFWLEFLKVLGYEMLAIVLIALAGTIFEMLRPLMCKYFYEYSEAPTDYSDILNANPRYLSPQQRTLQKIIKYAVLATFVAMLIVPWTATRFDYAYHEFIPRLAICWLVARTIYAVKDMCIILWLQLHHH